MKKEELKDFLDRKVVEYNNQDFIPEDPICIPHLFKKKQDIEISGLMAAVFAWGQRKTIINKSKEFLHLMDDDPHAFVLNHSDNDLKPFLDFKHRTFNATDALYFIHFFKWFYSKYDSLEFAFSSQMNEEDTTIENGLIGFFNLFFSLPDFPVRTKKHVPTPLRKSACKRINMFLRWMVRDDQTGVDFGLWKNIQPRQLVCPCDLHVDRVARKLGLIRRKQMDWLTAIELTTALRAFDANDPVKYDFALFGLGVVEKF